MEKENIYDYDDFRLFLKDFYLRKKSSGKSFSFRSFSRLAELQSPNFIKLVIDGERNLTMNSIFKLASAMRLRPHEHEYFEALVNFTQEKDQDVRNYYRLKMERLRPIFVPNPMSINQIEGTTKAALEDSMWEAVMIFVEGRSKQQVQKILRENRIQKASLIESNINKALEYGYLQIVKGRYKCNLEGIAIFDIWRNDESSKRHLKNQISETLENFESLYKKKMSQFTTITFATKDATELQFLGKRLIDSVRQEVDGIPDIAPEERGIVFRVNLQIYPVIERVSEDGESYSLNTP